MMLKLKISENPNMFQGAHRFTCHDQIWWKSDIAKLPKSHIVLLTKTWVCGKRAKFMSRQSSQVQW